jgi:hypothetical protein
VRRRCRHFCKMRTPSSSHTTCTNLAPLLPISLYFQTLCFGMARCAPGLLPGLVREGLGVACHPESSAAAAPPHGTRLSSPPLLHSWSPARFIIATTLKYIRFGTSLLAPASFPGELFRVKGAVYSKYDTHSSYHLILRFAPSLAHLIFLINMSYDYCMPARIAPALLVEERHSPKLCCYRVPSTTLTTHVHLPLHL